MIVTWACWLEFYCRMQPFGLPEYSRYPIRKEFGHEMWLRALLQQKCTFTRMKKTVFHPIAQPHQYICDLI